MTELAPAHQEQEANSIKLFIGQPKKDITIPVRLATGTRDPIQFPVPLLRRKHGPFAVLKNRNPNLHEHAVKMSHSIPYLRRNVIKRWTRQADQAASLLS